MKLSLYYSDDRLFKNDNYFELFSKIGNTILADFSDRNYELSVSIVSKNKIHKFNKEYRNIDRPTDVLSFAFLESDNINDDSIPVNLGDIIICAEIAKKQAKKYHHSVKREFAFLFTHGLLHLLGFDHMNKKDEKVMFDKQDYYLNKLNIKR